MILRDEKYRAFTPKNTGFRRQRDAPCLGFLATSFTSARKGFPAMASIRKINGNYYAYFYDSSRDPKRKFYPLRVSLKSAAEKLKPPTKRFKFFVRKAKLKDRERLRFHSLRHTCAS